MMTTDTSGYGVEEGDRESSFSIPPYLQKLSFLKKIDAKGWLGLALATVSIPSLVNGGGNGKPITTDVGNAILTERTVELSDSQEQASFLLRMEQLESGLLNEQAQQFYGAAVNFQNEDGHYCSDKSLRSCLLSFQQTRAEEILVLGLSDSGSRSNNSRIAQLLFDIKAIELAIADQSEIDIATQAFIDSSLTHPEVKEAPIATFLDAFKTHQSRRRLTDTLQREQLETEYAQTKIERCRTSGGPECF